MLLLLFFFSPCTLKHYVNSPDKTFKHFAGPVLTSQLQTVYFCCKYTPAEFHGFVKIL